MNEFDKLLIQARKAVIQEGYSQEQAQKLCMIISDKFDDFLDEEYAKKSLKNAKYVENNKLTKCTHYCFPFNAPLIRLGK